MPGKLFLTDKRVRCLCCVEAGIDPAKCEMNDGSFNKHHKAAHAVCKCPKVTHVPPPLPPFVGFSDAIIKLADLQTQVIFPALCFF